MGVLGHLFLILPALCRQAATPLTVQKVGLELIRYMLSKTQRVRFFGRPDVHNLKEMILISSYHVKDWVLRPASFVGFSLSCKARFKPLYDICSHGIHHLIDRNVRSTIEQRVTITRNCPESRHDIPSPCDERLL